VVDPNRQDRQLFLVVLGRRGNCRLASQNRPRRSPFVLRWLGAKYSSNVLYEFADRLRGCCRFGIIWSVGIVVVIVIVLVLVLVASIGLLPTSIVILVLVLVPIIFVFIFPLSLRVSFFVPPFVRILVRIRVASLVSILRLGWLCCGCR